MITQIFLLNSNNVLVKKVAGFHSMLARFLISIISIMILTNLSAIALEQQDNKYEQWQKYSEKLRSDPNLIAYYDFQDGKGVTLKNRATGPQDNKEYNPQELDGALGEGKTEKMPTWTTGRWPGKKALLFDGRSDYVDCGKDEAFESDTKTIEVWFKLTNSSKEKKMTIIDKAYYGGVKKNYGYGINLEMKQPLLLQACAANEKKAHTWVYTAIEPDTWYYVVFVHDYLENKLYLYLDGKLKNKVETDGYFPCFDRTFAIGRHNACKFWHFKGIIDEVAVYNRVLTAQEIENHYKIGKPNNNERK